jgi:hypothetical protein
MISRNVFSERLQYAASAARDFASRFVQEQLPPTLQFNVYLNRSYDGNALVGDQVVFPDDRSILQAQLDRLSANDVITLLWRDGRIPQWIDISVETVIEHSVTIVALLCCGRYTGIEAQLYHQGSHAPFHVVGPPLPPGWNSVEQSGRFSLNWRPSSWARP